MKYDKYVFHCVCIIYIYICIYKLFLTITYKLTLALRQILLKLIRLNPINSCTSLPVWTEAEIWSQKLKSYKNHLKYSKVIMSYRRKVRTQPIESDLRCVGASGTPRLMPTAFAAKACRWTSRASATWCRRLQLAHSRNIVCNRPHIGNMMKYLWHGRPKQEKNGSCAHHVEGLWCFDREIQPCHPPQQSNGVLTPSHHWRCFSGREPSAHVSQQSQYRSDSAKYRVVVFSSWRLTYQNSNNACDMKSSLPFVPFGDRHTQPPWSPIRSVPLLHCCNPTH